MEGATTGARGSMPLMDEVILTEDYQTALSSSIPPRTEPSVHIRKSAD